MICRVLGRAPGLPKIDEFHSSVYVETSSKTYLVDCGEGTSQQLLRYELDKDKIDCILISHFHPDHIIGLYTVLQMFYLQNRTKDLEIYLPEKVEDFKKSLSFYYMFFEKYPYKIIFRNVQNLKSAVIQPIPNKHLLKYKAQKLKFNHESNQYKSYSYIFREDEKKLIITGDIVDIKNFEKYLAKNDCMVLDALHTNFRDCINMFNKFEDTNFILTHGISKELLEILLEDPEFNVDFANDQEIISI